MTKKLTQNLKCLVMRNGIELWIDGEKAEILESKLSNLDKHVFFTYEGRVINTADISGLFTAQDMADQEKRKNGQWRCERGNWHDKKSKCECRELRKCSKCGKVEPSFWMEVEGGICGECWKNL